MTFIKIIQSFFCSLALLVLVILYAGLILSALLSIVGGLLRTIGLEQIRMSLWSGVDLPVAFSIPLALVVALLLFFCSMYVKRSIQFCLSKLKF
ncbi:hypothetical protein [Lysinibacillus pakistanensis]|uniref:Uncharacterized protein n=1 Tax=Lysinibacillus pakistanensis TaxID=759811 RepID=A0AAX3WYW4_9BACI|nr:hypothetical protein [Lysinibacillus pakistanensis]MDM5231066.1 hypothetical protein [Lysinibacillus pakistanensis]QGG53745.1 hypothetical protein GDS87_24040 [Lysinibacillus pakistanensis]WHY46627.1 hypothetical protein QNH22_25940 [Lysinibacillus pakistanensis]WHY51640.1 hypothetical protein QNH24_25900 [Lysinibacillus pakistanensis]